MANIIRYSFERYENKYFLTPAQYAHIIEDIRPYVKEDDYGRYTICNIYCDSDDWSVVRASTGAPDYKEKLRLRSYGTVGDDGSVFAEIKKKYAGIVYKRRISIGASETDAIFSRHFGVGGTQTEREIGHFVGFYKAVPKVFIAYDREAYAGLYDPELRITFDTGIRWRTGELDLRAGDHGKALLGDARILMEIKLPGVCPMLLAGILSENGAFPVPFSKYGTCYRENILKKDFCEKEAHFCA